MSANPALENCKLVNVLSERECVFFVLTVYRPVVMDAGLTQPQCLGCGNNEFQCPLRPICTDTKS